MKIKKDINKAMQKCFESGDFILGGTVRRFEENFAAYCGTLYALGVSSGTDALKLALLSVGIGEGDEVIVPSFTFTATAEAVVHCGAKPVFVDIDKETYCIDAKKIEAAVTKRTKAVVPVHLYGHPADMDAIIKLSKNRGLYVIEDAAQAHGSLYNGKKVGSLGHAGCFSFYPTKNLGACGDAGIITTNSKKIADKIKLLRDHGRKGKYNHNVCGFNSRLDAIQAGILDVKLSKLNSWNEKRREKAGLYSRLLKGLDISLPVEKDGCRHVYHIFTVMAKDRNKLAAFLRMKGINTAVHYPVPLHIQTAYKSFGYKKSSLPVSEYAAKHVLSLPMHPELTDTEIKVVANEIKKFFKKNKKNA